MKLKSFLFLAAALAIGLVLAGCSPDPKEVPGPTIKHGYASDDAAAIMAAFEFAPEVWLAKETNLKDSILVIPANKTLHVNGKRVNVNEGTIIAVDGTLDLDADDSVIYSEVAGAVLVNVTGQLDTAENQAAHYGSASTPPTAGTAGPVFVKNDGTPTDTASNRYIAGPASAALQGGTKSAATGAGTTVIVLGNNTVSNGNYDTGGGTLLVTGNLDFGTGYVKNGGYLYVYGKLSGGTLDSASHVLQEAAGVAIAKTAEIKGGSISNALSVLNATFGAATSGTLVTFGGALMTSDVPVTFAGPAKFITAPTTLDKAVFNKDVEFDAAAVTIADAEFGGNVTSATEQTTATAARFTGTSPTVTGYLKVETLSGNVTVKSGSLSTDKTLTLGTGLSVILGASGGIEITGTGKLAGTDYEVSGAGSLLNTEASGTTVTLAASGITRQTGATSVPSIVFGGVANLIYKDNATISGFNLDVSDGGSITVGSKSATLTITGGGSITAGGDPAGTLADGKLYIVTNTAGSLVAGTLMGDSTIGAGSYGTFAEATNFIYSGVTPELAGTKAAFGLANSDTGIDGDSGKLAIDEEKLAVFSDAE
ncbi:MAG: hypothetical protein LBJ86_05215 [Spirochaetaceae bacterium]|jgi:hypothetical protein|nr:hypothetical protein [Spirochaetaceae bacterium]